MQQLFGAPKKSSSSAAEGADDASSNKSPDSFQLPVRRYSLPEGAVPAGATFLHTGSARSPAAAAAAFSTPGDAQDKTKGGEAQEAHQSRKRGASALTDGALENILSTSASTMSPGAVSEQAKKDIYGFFEYGVQATRPSELLIELYSSRSNPAALLSRDRVGSMHGSNTGSSSSGSHASGGRGGAGGAAAQSPLQRRHNAVVLAVRQALSIVCRLVHADASRRFLLSVPVAADLAATSQGEVSPSRYHHGFLQLYTVLGGVEVELGDVAAQLASAEEQHGGAESRRVLEAVARVEDAHTRAVSYLDALETTVVNILLDSARFSRADDDAPPTREEVVEVLRAVPGIFREESWPIQLLGNSDMYAAARENAAAAAVTRGTLDTAVPRTFAASAITAASCAGLSDGVSSIILSAMRDLQAADVRGVLVPPGERRSVPITVTVARAARANGQRKGTASSHSSAGQQHAGAETAVVDSVSLTDLRARAWSGCYGTTGLRRAHLEMRALCRGLELAASVGTNDSAAKRRHSKSASTVSSSSGAHADEVQRLWRLWSVLLDDHYCNFMATVLPAGAVPPPLFGSPSSEDIFDLARAARPGAKGQSKVQEAALRALKALMAVDKDGWFAVPAFDMVNVDFGSIRCWVEGRGFANKTGREAFASLRDILERMVDSCVEKYGPTHRFSLQIVAVRQKLVDVARAEGLLL